MQQDLGEKVTQILIQLKENQDNPTAKADILSMRKTRGSCIFSVIHLRMSRRMALITMVATAI